MDPPSSGPVRVLIRPSATPAPVPISSSSTALPPRVSSTPPAPPQSSSAPLRQSSFSSSASSSSSAAPYPLPTPEGVVVVGFIGRRSDDVTQLINRILDASVFGFGNGDVDLLSRFRNVEETGAARGERYDFSRFRRMSYYYDEEKGIVYLQLSSLNEGALMEGLSRLKDETPLDSILQEAESEDLKGMLVMFCVCHIIIYLHEGSRFDTHLMKRLRMLQAAKHTLAPFIKSQITPMLSSRTSISSSSQSIARSNSSKSPPPTRGGGSSGRQTSAISLMSGLSSSPFLYPGQYVPVLLFAFLDDFPDGQNFVSRVEDPTDGTLANQSSAAPSLLRPTLPTKSPTSIVMLARPTSKSEGNFRKKLQSSLEAQMRSLIRKSRILAGAEGSHSAARSGVHAMNSPLFSLDSSRAIVLLDKYTNCKGESLDFATGLIKDVLTTNQSLETLMLENYSQNLNKDDIASVKDFIYRQNETLRGKGGLASNNASTTGVGMVAVAAAAAAASVASGKQSSASPRLPTFDDWISCAHLFLNYLICRHGVVNERHTHKSISANRKDAFDGVKSSVSFLESGKDLNTKFSTSWCGRALPAAKEIYLKDLPSCYPTVVHESQLEKAVRAFILMVKGPAVQIFAKKLEEECNSIWKSGRQLCDAVSLTGKPCVHRRHDVSTPDSLFEIEVKPHSSGYVFLHACACGRSRQVRNDPFDFESANINFNCFPDCESLLPTIQLPKAGDTSQTQISSWSLIRVGGAKYYEPTKGLLQSGFCATEKFLLKWTILLEERILPNGMTTTVISQKRSTKSHTHTLLSPVAESETKESESARPDQLAKPSESAPPDDPKIKFGRGIPLFALKKPFSEVVAGTVASELAFPPLQSKKQPLPNSEKTNKQRLTRDKNEDRNVLTNGKKTHAPEDVTDKENSFSVSKEGDPFLQIGSNVIPVNVNDGGKLKVDTLLQHVVIYVGFEHECPCGHRFLLSPQHLNELSLHSLTEESVTSSFLKHSEEPSNLVDKNSWNQQNKLHNVHAEVSKSAKDIGGRLQDMTLDDGGSAFSLLNRNLPIYMNCPHCKVSGSKVDREKMKSASTISQLQRIFVVTPSFPVVLATCPVVQFEDSCLPPSVLDCERQSRFSLGCQVILPPDSFLTLRLPFIYGVQLKDKTSYPLKCLDHQPEVTAWISKGTVLQVVSLGSNSDEEFQK